MAAAAKKIPAVDARRDMHKELAAAAALKHQLTEAFGEERDLTLLRDMVEGETNLDGAIDRVLEQMATDTASIEGLKIVEAKMEGRRKRLSDRYDAMKAMLLNVLDILEERRIERPLALFFTKAVSPSLQIIDEGEIPTRYFKQPDPVLSKADLTRDLKDRRDTLAGKLGEIVSRVNAGEMSEDDADQARDRILAAFPEIPGADLDNGGVTIQVKWS